MEPTWRRYKWSKDEIETYRDQLLKRWDEYKEIASVDPERANPTPFLQEQKKCILYRWHFLTHWCKTLDEHHPTTPMQLVPNKAYLQYINDFDNSEEGYLAAYYKSRQIMVSWLFTCFAVHEVCLLVGQKIFIQRMNEQSARALIERAKLVINNLPEFLKPTDLKFLIYQISTEEGLSELTALPEGAKQIVGRTGTRVVIDECQENKELDQTFRKVKPALDSATGTPGKLSFIGTPEIGEWLELIEDRNNPRDGGLRGKTMYRKPIRGVETWQNLYNKINVCQIHHTADPDKDPERDGKIWYDKLLASTPRKDYEKEYNLNARSEAGSLIYPEFKESYAPDGHLRKPWELPLTDPYQCTLYMILDHGVSDYTAALWVAAMKDGQIILYREHYVPEKNVKWHVDKCRELEGWLPRTPEESEEPWEFIRRDKRTQYTEPIFIRMIDPATNKRSAVDRATIFNEYNSVRNSMGFILAQNPWELGRTLVSYLLMSKLPDGRPKFVVFDTLTHFLNEIRNYRRSDKPGKEDDKPMGINDHLMDSLRMGVLTPPHLKFIPPDEYQETKKDECSFPGSDNDDKIWTPKTYHGYGARRR